MGLMDTAKQLKLEPADLQMLVPSECRYCIVQTIENGDGRSMSLLSLCDKEGEARQAAAALFEERKDQYEGLTLGIGVVDMEHPEYMQSCRFTFAKVKKNLS